MGKPCARVCVIRAEGDGVEPVLVLQTEKGSWCRLNHGTAVGPPQYMFGAPEGLSRLLLTHRRILGEDGPPLPSPSLKAIFASTLHPNQVGGLVGLFLRLKADGHEKVHLFGPRGLVGPLLFNCQNIVRWTYPYVLVTEHEDDTPTTLVYSDDLIDVWVTSGQPGERLDGLARFGPSGDFPDASTFAALSESSVCLPREQLGRRAAEARGEGNRRAAPSPVLAHCIKLKKIEKLVVIVDCASEGEAGTLLRSGFWACLAENQSCISQVFHRSAEDAMKSQSYHSLLAALSGATHVNMRSGAHMEFGFSGSLKTLLKLSGVDKRAFKLPVSESAGSIGCGQGEQNMLSWAGVFHSFGLFDDGRWEAEEVPRDTLNDRFRLALGTENSESSSSDNGEAQVVEDGNRGAASLLRDSILRGGSAQRAEPAAKRHCKEAGGVRVVFFGTGCAEPSKYRGGTGILVEWGSGSMLLDCGESVWGQMIRHFGKKKALKKLSSLSCLWISHKHADHLLGLVSLLHNRPPSSKRLLLIGPHVAFKWLRSCDPSLLGKCVFKHHTHFMKDPEILQRFMAPLGIAHFASIPVYHCRDSYAVVFGHRAGWKISFSGDCRPCRSFVEASKGSTVLIHEATFETKYHKHAERKNHCTITEALEVSKQVGAGITILTHFSQRYPYIPMELQEIMKGEGCGERETSTPPVLVAFDGMCVELSRLSEYAATTPRVAQLLTSEAAVEGALDDKVGA